MTLNINSFLPYMTGVSEQFPMYPHYKIPHLVNGIRLIADFHMT